MKIKISVHSTDKLTGDHGYKSVTKIACYYSLYHPLPQSSPRDSSPERKFDPTTQTKQGLLSHTGPGY